MFFFHVFFSILLLPVLSSSPNVPKLKEELNYQCTPPSSCVTYPICKYSFPPVIPPPTQHLRGCERSQDWFHPCSFALVHEELLEITDENEKYLFKDIPFNEVQVIFNRASRVSKVILEDNSIMILKTGNWSYIKREFRILRYLEGRDHPFISKLITGVRSPFCRRSLLFPLYPGDHFDEKHLPSKSDCLLLFHHLFEALSYAHSKGIIHGDVKPSNILFDSRTKSFKLIDWGVSILYDPNLCCEKTFKVGTLSYMAPEFYLRKQKIDFQVDIWSASVSFIYLFMRKRNVFKFFSEMDDLECLISIIYQLGINSFDFSDQYCEFEYFCSYSGTNFLNAICNDEDAKDFVLKTLVPNPKGRMTSMECLEHPLFMI